MRTLEPAQVRLSEGERIRPVIRFWLFSIIVKARNVDSNRTTMVRFNYA